MKFKLRKIGLTALVMAIIGYGCFSPVTTDLEYQPEYLGPIAYSNITPEKFAETIEPKGTYNIYASQVPPGFQVGVPVTVPPIGPVDLPPQYYDISELIHSITANKAIFTISFTNNLPIAVSQGTRLVAFDSSNQQNVIFDHKLTRDVAPGKSYQNTEEAQAKTLKSDWGMQVKDFQSPGGNNVTFSEDTTSITVSLDIVEFLTAQLNPNESYSFQFNTPVDFSITDTAEDYNITGYLSFFFENNLPVNLSLKMNLLNSVGDTTFRFFDGQTITVDAPSIDAQGHAMGPNVVDYIEVESLDTLQQIKNVTQLNSTMTFATPAAGTKLQIDDNNFFEIKLSTKASAKIDIEQ